MRLDEVPPDRRPGIERGAPPSHLSQGRDHRGDGVSLYRVPRPSDHPASRQRSGEHGVRRDRGIRGRRERLLRQGRQRRRRAVRRGQQLPGVRRQLSPSLRQHLLPRRGQPRMARDRNEAGMGQHRVSGHDPMRAVPCHVQQSVRSFRGCEDPVFRRQPRGALQAVHRRRGRGSGQPGPPDRPSRPRSHRMGMRVLSQRGHELHQLSCIAFRVEYLSTDFHACRRESRFQADRRNSRDGCEPSCRGDARGDAGLRLLPLDGHGGDENLSGSRNDGGRRGQGELGQRELPARLPDLSQRDHSGEQQGRGRRDPRSQRPGGRYRVRSRSAGPQQTHVERKLPRDGEPGGEPDLRSVPRHVVPAHQPCERQHVRREPPDGQRERRDRNHTGPPVCALRATPTPERAPRRRRASTRTGTRASRNGSRTTRSSWSARSATSRTGW